MNGIGVLQLTTALEPGGLERMCVNLANALPRSRYRVHLATTRAEGPLAGLVAPDVARLSLARRGRFDLAAVSRFASYVRENRIELVHAHGTALFFAAAASIRTPRVRILWHDHFGRFGIEPRPSWLYRLAARRLDGVVSVTEPLTAWARRTLPLPAERVWYLPNFVASPHAETTAPELPGRPGFRIACVANLRREKDHATLLEAMQQIVREVPSAHLILLGATVDPSIADRVAAASAQPPLAGHVSFLGSRDDVPAVLAGCDVGVLSSVSEGLPLALLEYGLAALPAVATRVGQCPEVLDDGRAGLLVPASDPHALANAVVSLLTSAEERLRLGRRLRDRIREVYGEDRAVERLVGIYDDLLRPAAASAAA